MHAVSWWSKCGCFLNLEGDTTANFILIPKMLCIHYPLIYLIVNIFWKSELNILSTRLIVWDDFQNTCKQGEVCWAGDGEEGWGDVFCPHPIPGHLIQARGVHVLVIVPAETIEGDEQQLVSGSCSIWWWDSSRQRAAGEAEHSEEDQQHCRGLTHGTTLLVICLNGPAFLTFLQWSVYKQFWTLESIWFYYLIWRKSDKRRGVLHP